MDSAIISDSPPTGRKLSDFGDIRKDDFRIGVAGESECLDLAIGEILRIPFMAAERAGSQVKHIDRALRHRVRRPAVPFRFMVMVKLNGDYEATSDIGAAPAESTHPEFEPDCEIRQTHPVLTDRRDSFFT